MDVHEQKINLLDQYAVGHDSRTAKVEAYSTQMITEGRSLTQRTQALEDTTNSIDITIRCKDKKSLVEIKAVVNQKPYG